MDGDGDAGVNFSTHMIDFSLIIPIFVVALFLLTSSVLIACSFLRSAMLLEALRQASLRRVLQENDESKALEDGLDEAVLKSWPMLTLAEAKSRRHDRVAGGCCSVCLTEYGDGHVLRLLPECGHVFHVKCVDPWLRRQPTCPLCRSSLLPSLLLVPLAEVVTVATRLD